MSHQIELYSRDYMYLNCTAIIHSLHGEKELMMMTLSMITPGW